MAIDAYIKEIGRGKQGARALERTQAADLLGQILDGQVSDLAIGAFCVAMRIKGETPQEMAGFLDAVHQRIHLLRSQLPIVVIPSYNGARKLPGLTTLLAALLARHGAKRGFGVMVHGCASEADRVPTQDVFTAVFKKNQSPSIMEYAKDAIELVVSEEHVLSATPVFIPTERLSSALFKLLQVRRSIGLRNPAHSLVKLINPTNRADALIVTSYTHPEYLSNMTDTLQLTARHALLLRGTEGESVADARRHPRMDGLIHGHRITLCEAQTGSLAQLPELPTRCDVATTAAYIQDILSGNKPIPAPIAAQVEHILHLMAQLKTPRSTA